MRMKPELRDFVKSRLTICQLLHFNCRVRDTDVSGSRYDWSVISNICRLELVYLVEPTIGHGWPRLKMIKDSTLPTKTSKKIRKPIMVQSKCYKSQIIKSGALIADTKVIFSNWDSSITADENFSRIISHNLLGKSSRRRASDELAIFKKRYLRDPSVFEALRVFIKRRSKVNILEKLLYFHTALADDLLFDFVCEYVDVRRKAGLFDIGVKESVARILQWAEEGRAKTIWSEPTANRIVQGLLSTLRDFGVLEGAVSKRVAALSVPIESFAYIMFYLLRENKSVERVFVLPHWRLFFQSRDEVEKLLFEAHQHGLLEYHVAGSVTRLTFPANTLEEYANVLAQR